MFNNHLSHTSINYYEGIEELLFFINNKINSESFYIVDKKVYEIYKDSFFSKIINYSDNNSFIITDGEKSKNLVTVENILAKMLKIGIKTDAVVFGIGGGVTLDISGLVSSLYHRGISYVSVPTTLLACVDAGVGGKNGVDYIYKNSIGSYYNPSYYAVCKSFLASLDKKTLHEGLVEIIKIALLLDKKMFYEIYYYIINKYKSDDNSNEDLYLYPEWEVYYNCFVKKAISLKLKIVNKDYYGNNLRNILNLGHTYGHAYEKCSNFLITHGEAVALGILKILEISTNLEVLKNDKLYNEVTTLFQLLDLVKYKDTFDNDEIIKYLPQDKKNSSNGLNLILLKDIEKYVIKSVKI
ncbi:MAG: 3-dehydroquinate synthase [Acholeplasmatales bacterium]|jgi:3-dehydroquinate synthase|nr:3-dehydroquinate synthase [Acholeplasmatales bacterium]